MAEENTSSFRSGSSNKSIIFFFFLHICAFLFFFCFCCKRSRYGNTHLNSYLNCYSVNEKQLYRQQQQKKKENDTNFFFEKKKYPCFFALPFSVHFGQLICKIFFSFLLRIFFLLLSLFILFCCCYCSVSFCLHWHREKKREIWERKKKEKERKNEEKKKGEEKWTVAESLL